MTEIPDSEIPIRANAAATINCPGCGGVNTADAIFCANPACHKALGEFHYVLEELDAARGWIEHLADRVTGFAGRPHFVTVHLVWFVFWVLANSGLIAVLKGFDAYPYALLSFILAIEAILMTGFLLISQNRQQAYSEKRAELDYEVNIRSYRKLIELEKRLDALVRMHPPTGTKPDHE
jgi:uncharacterized membrane protein